MPILNKPRPTSKREQSPGVGGIGTIELVAVVVQDIGTRMGQQCEQHGDAGANPIKSTTTGGCA
jgi:hypothetical protein